MEIVLKFDWANHGHIFKLVTRRGGDSYTDTADEICRICEVAARQSGIPTNEHYKHPKGCKCYWCVFCICHEVYVRESS